MATRSKIVVASGIVAVLVGVILYDVFKTGAGGAAPDTGAQAQPFGTLGGLAVEAERAEITNALENVGRELDRTVRQTMGNLAPAPQTPAVPVVVPATPQTAPEPVTGSPETYEVKDGDNLYNIAQMKYGDGSLFTLIERANPGLRPNLIRAGMKITIPAKPAAGIPSAEGVAIAAPPAGDSKVYVVQSGDTLSKISKRFFKSEQFADRIYEANRNVIDNPDFLFVGAKITLPEVPATPERTVVTAADPVEETHTASGRTTYRVKSGDSLWKIARTVANGRKIMDVMERIREANADKIKSAGDALQVDWVLVLPE